MMYTPAAIVPRTERATAQAAGMGVRIVPIPFMQLMRDCGGMFERHWREVAAHPSVPLRIDVDAYCALERADRLLSFAALDDEGIAVGYTVFTLAYHGHYADTLHAMNDVIYVDPGRRGARIGLKLIRAAEAALKAKGVRVIRYHVKSYLDWSRMLEHEGYGFTDKILDKVLD